jgi:hypothetical protein
MIATVARSPASPCSRTKAEDWKPTHFGYQLFGCEVGIRFPTVKILDYADQAEALLTDPNPFALVTAAHLFHPPDKR